MKLSTAANKLSELPEEVLNRILCFLPQKQALQTCVLSKSWRRVGSTRSKLEFSQTDDFNGDRQKFTSVLCNTLQRYIHQKLLVDQLVLKMNFDPSTIPFKLEFLHELHLQHCDLSLIIDSDDDDNLMNILLNHLRKLTLDRVLISNESLEILLSRSPLLEYLAVSNDSKEGSKSVIKTKALNLKHFVCFRVVSPISYQRVIRIDVPTLETIRMVGCGGWYFHHDDYFPHLKSVYLESVRLPYESFSFFSSNYMPSLEVLQLNQCEGFKEFYLSSPSIKLLCISGLGIPIKATIDALNIVYFQLKLVALPTLSFTTISSECKSQLDVLFHVCHRNASLRWILKLYELLEALSQSQITLKLGFVLQYKYPVEIEDTTYGGLCNKDPIVVEHLSLGLPRDYSASTMPFMFNYLFRVCRPRYIDVDSLSRTSDLAVILTRVLLHERERSDYFWNQDLVEVSIETYCCATNEWCPVYGDSLSESAMPDNQLIRFGLKWRD